MASSVIDGDARDEEIRLWREAEWWIATDIDTGVTTQGPSREDALANLDEAVALHAGETGEEPTDEELRELGIDFRCGSREGTGERRRLRAASNDGRSRPVVLRTSHERRRPAAGNGSAPRRTP